MNYYDDSKLLRRSNFSTAGSFGNGSEERCPKALLKNSDFVGGFEKGLAGGGWRQTKPEKEKFQGATRLGATGLRASEKKSASERVSERTSENLSKISENL